MMVYSLEEVTESTKQYFNGDDLATNVWIRKYCLKDQDGRFLELNPNHMHHRLASEFARIERKYPNPVSEEDIFELFKDFKYVVPQGSPMYGIGNNFSTTSLSNCFVIGNNDRSDSYGSIMRTDEEQIQLMKRRGGVGHDISHLRPSGSMANNSVLGSLAGTTLYMDRFSNSTREVAQDGRRGALMLSIDVSHPDADKFIDIKMESGRVTGANISVKISDDFMNAVERDMDFVQSFPTKHRDEWQNRLIDTFYKAREDREYDKLYVLGDGVYAKKIKAKQLWNKIILNAHKSAEPGVLFWDTILKESPAGCYGDDWKEVSTNPCFTEDTIIAVADGRNGVSIKDLSELKDEFIVYSARKNKSNGNRGKGWKVEIKKAKAFKTGNKKVIKIILSDDSCFKCTPDHLLALDDNSYLEAKDSLGLNISKFYSYSQKTINKSYRHINSLSNGSARQYRMIWEFYNGKTDGKSHNIDHINLDSTDDTIDNLRLLKTQDHLDLTLRKGDNNPIQKIKGSEYLSLYSKRSCIQANGKKYKWSEEKIQTKLNEFDKIWGKNLIESKKKNIDVILNEKVYVKEIVELGFEDVYDLTVEDNHNFYIITKTDDPNYLNSSGVLVHNCGEIPLNPYDSCRLIAINLYSYVDQPFTDKAGFDHVKFSKDVKTAQRLMDDLVDLEIEKLGKIIAKIESDKEPEDIKRVELDLWRKIKSKAVSGRRTGLGITGEADMLAALNLRYGSEHATEFSVEVHRIMAICSYESSVEMAKERGAFPIWSLDKEELWSRFVNRILDEPNEFISDYFLYGRRNIANLTIAPTGTTSLMTQTTSGIEPLFKPFYKRRTKIEDKSKVTFVDENGDGWEEYFVIHPKFTEWFRINYWDRVSDETYAPFSSPEQFLRSCSEHLLQKFLEDSPYYKATANDIDWKASVTMQGAVQRWIDHSISKTVNVPEHTTVQQIDEIYREAYKAGCKGVTVYRDGSRSGVLVSSKKEEERFEYVNAYKRPATTECDVYHKTALKQNWMVIVGKVKGKPYEIFAIKDVDNHVFPTKIENGSITKVKPKTYRLEGLLGEKMYRLENIVSLMSDTEGMDTRKYSSMLRHRMHPKYIIDQIEEYATIGSFDKVVQRVLRNYVEEEEIKSNKEVCPNCGGEVVYEEGCRHCTQCDYSKCGG